MRQSLIVFASLLAAAAWSCGGSSSPSASPTAAPSTTAAALSSPQASLTAGGTPSADTGSPVATAPAATDEVTGIVGSVNVASSTIQIDHLSGAPVIKITVDPSTVIRLAGGGTIGLADIHVSDRIIASGHLNDRNDALIAAEITVQEVVSGAPGG